MFAFTLSLKVQYMVEKKTWWQELDVADITHSDIDECRHSAHSSLVIQSWAPA